jgi:hypothetical protein
MRTTQWDIQNQQEWVILTKRNTMITDVMEQSNSLHLNDSMEEFKKQQRSQSVAANFSALTVKKRFKILPL